MTFLGDNPWLVVLLFFFFCTGLPSLAAFYIGRWGMPKLVFPRRVGQPRNEVDL